MHRSLVATILLSLAACTAPNGKSAEPAKPAEPAEPAAEPAKPDAEPAKPGENGRLSRDDRAADPAFALKKDGDNYVGLVLDRCPEGFRIADKLRDGEPKLVGDKLHLTLFFGGCPHYTGFAVVPGSGSPLPFYLCEDSQHDPCEMLGRATWVFDIGEALKQNNATAVTYEVPR
jgi:hypothetical protein